MEGDYPKDTKETKDTKVDTEAEAETSGLRDRTMRSGRESETGL
jgi:hypothetical protein